MRLRIISFFHIGQNIDSHFKHLLDFCLGCRLLIDHKGWGNAKDRNKKNGQCNALLHCKCLIWIYIVSSLLPELVKAGRKASILFSCFPISFITIISQISLTTLMLDISTRSSPRLRTRCELFFSSFFCGRMTREQSKNP